MVRLWLILALVAVVFTVYCIVDCALQPATRHRGVPKGVWIVITFIPVIGGVMWLLVGRTRRSTMIAARNAPDDDPAFLSTLGSISDQDERIRRLEEELAQLDAEEGGTAPEADGHPTPRRPDDDEPR